MPSGQAARIVNIVFRALEKKPLSTEDAGRMRELVAEHATARRATGELVKANADFLAGREGSRAVILEKLQFLTDFYSKHIAKEDKRFFRTPRNTSAPPSSTPCWRRSTNSTGA